MRRLPLCLPALLVTLSACSYFTAENPDPNHSHADFAVWVEATKLDFSDAIYMSSAPRTDASGQLVPTEIPGRQYLHLHNENGHVMHRHKPGLTLADFFSSIGLKMSKTCLTLDTLQLSKLDAGWKRDFGITKNLCTDGKFHWTMVVNDREMPMNPDYVFADNDKIMLSYSAADIWSGEWAKMTDDACLYSQTCPWRGKPPVEGCIADPTVPCTE